MPNRHLLSKALGTAALYPNAAIDESTSGDRTIVSVAAGSRFKLISLFLMTGGTVNITIKTGSTSRSGALPMVANLGFHYDPGPQAPLVGADGEDFVLNLSGAVQVSGTVIYALE